MSTLFPGAQDDATTLPNPGTTDKTNNPDHAGLHGNAHDAIKAIEAKLGTGATTPAANYLLFGSGSGTSVWKQLTSAELIATLTDETGTGSAVFANTPTLVTPKVNIINEATAANGVTIDGLNLKDGKLNTNDSVVENNITDGAVTTDKLGLFSPANGALVTTNETTTSTSYTDLTTTTDTVTVTIGANGLALVLFGSYILNSASGNFGFTTFAASGTNTIAAGTHTFEFKTASTANDIEASNHVFLSGLNPGSTTFKLKYKVSGGTGTFGNRRITVLPL